MSVVLQARQRMHGLSEDQARSDHATTELGRLWLKGVITEAQRVAGERFLKWHQEYLRAIAAPGGPVSPRAMFVAQERLDQAPIAKGTFAPDKRFAGGPWEIVPANVAMAVVDAPRASDEHYVEWATKAVARHELAKGWLESVSVYAAVIVEAVVLADSPLLFASQREFIAGLTYLAKRMGIPEKPTLDQSREAP